MEYKKATKSHDDLVQQLNRSRCSKGVALSRKAIKMEKIMYHLPCGM